MLAILLFSYSSWFGPGRRHKFCELNEKLYLSILFDDDIKCCLCYTFIHRVCTLNNSILACFCVFHIYLILRFWKTGIHEFLVYVILSATDQFLYPNHWTHTGTQSDIDGGTECVSHMVTNGTSPFWRSRIPQRRTAWHFTETCQ